MKKKTEKILRKSTSILVGISLIILIYGIYHFWSTGACSLEFGMKKILKGDEVYCMPEMSGIGLISFNHGCVPRIGLISFSFK